MTQKQQDELLDRARKVIRELREKLSVAEAQSRPVPIAIIGVGLRFPGCGDDPEQFWRMIAEGRDAVTAVPPDRWDGDAFYAPGSTVQGKINTRHAAFLDDVKRFDAAFFDITPREAVRMDPQQRIFLETAWHAIEDAGLTKARISASDAGIFVGVHNHSVDYQSMQYDRLAELDAYSATGTAHDMIAGRLAYWLDLHGPAIAVNSACSSSLTAVHFACRSLSAGDCSVALAGGVNLLVSPGSWVAAAQLQLLSPEGRCKTFDARADGMGRGEGCGVVVLKKLDAAQRDGDRVLAVIRGSAVNQDGRTNGLTAPNGLAQQQVVRRALKEADIDPSEIGYVEAHGTGTVLGDPIEVEALAEVLGGGRRNAPCTLGAVKANIGHLEGAAGIAGLIKTVLVLRHCWIPPVAKLTNLNPHLAFDRKDLEVPQQGREWKTTGKRFAGVSSFGFSGTNAHVVLEEASSGNATAPPSSELPVMISAQSFDALRALAIAYADRLEHSEVFELIDISYTSAMRRTHHSHRVAVVGTSPNEMASQLRRRVADMDCGERGFSRMQPTGSDKGLNEVEQLVRDWENGVQVDWANIFASPASVVDLPRYPFQRREYWLDVPRTSGIISADIPLPHDWFYVTDWVEKELNESLAPASDQVRTWVVLDSEDLFGEELVEAIRGRGDIAIKPAKVSNSAERLESAFAEFQRDRVTSISVVYVPTGQDPVVMIADALEVTKTILRCSHKVKLWFITQQIEPIARTGLAPHPAQAAIQGFSRVFGLEHPEFAGGVIDTVSGSAESAKAVCEEISQDIGEDRVALRQGRRWVARLRRENLIAGDKRLNLNADKCYLVTGAFGRLGIQIAGWLVDRGACHLALVGRRSPEDMANLDLIAKLEALRARGITVLAEACDVSDESQVMSLLARIDQTGKSLAGVVHAAAGMRFSPLEEASRQDVEFSFRAKFAGACTLDYCMRARPLDFFVLFNSAAATIGLRNGALYAAANSCLESIVLERHSLGLPVLNVEWGTWEQQTKDRQQELVERSGFRPMQSARALRVLETLIVSRRESGLVADIDWRTLSAALGMRGRDLLIREVGRDGKEGSSEGVPPGPQAEENTAATQWLDKLRDLPLIDRNLGLLNYVSREVRQVFGMSPQDPIDECCGLFELGMDSLMSVDLKRRLESGTGLQLPDTVTLTYPSITVLAQYLGEKLFPSTDASPVQSREPLISVLSDSVAEMNEVETHAAITAELAAIQQMLGVL